MKNYLLMFMLLFLFGCNADSENDASKRNGDWVWWVDEHTGKGEWIKSGDHTTVKDGKYTMFYYNGNVYEKGRLKNGENVDTSFLYDTSGKGYGYRVDKPGIIHYFYYSNGPIKIYFNTGELNGEGLIANNRREKWVGYLRDGQISFQHDYTNGVGWCTENFNNGKPKRIFYNLGYNNSVLDFKKWNESGILIFEAEISNGKYNGIMKRYYDNGKIRSIHSMENDSNSGAFQEYFENGQLNFKGYAHNGLRTGEYFQFYDNGQIELRTQFINDKPDGLFQGFFPNGNRKIVCYYKNGKKDGVWQSYDSTGKYLSKEIYQNDVRLN